MGVCRALPREKDLNTFLFRAIIAGVISGLIVGIVVFFKADIIISLIEKMAEQTGPEASGEAVKPYIDLTKTLLRLAPLTQPLNSAVSIAILGLISWGIARVAKAGYRVASIIMVALYVLITLASTYYMARLTGDLSPLYYIGVPSTVSFIAVFIILEWKDLPGTEPKMT